MTLNIDIHNFSLVNINFLDTKKNIIMDGNFTKIIYSNNTLHNIGFTDNYYGMSYFDLNASVVDNNIDFPTETISFDYLGGITRTVIIAHIVLTTEGYEFWWPTNTFPAITFKFKKRCDAVLIKLFV